MFINNITQQYRHRSHKQNNVVMSSSNMEYVPKQRNAIVGGVALSCYLS